MPAQAAAAQPFVGVLPCAYSSPLLAVLADGGNMNLISSIGKTNMYKERPVSEMPASAQPAPIVSGPKRPVPARREIRTDVDKRMSKMKAAIKRMQQQLKRFWAATDPKERHKLMQAHVQTLRECMNTMRSMRVTR